MLDTLKTATAGLGVTWLPHLDIVPDIASLLVAIATFIYLTIKIKKELKK
jgi:DNA-binding transcriptional LysR family regulator